MILIGLGANLNSPVHGPPRATIDAALAVLDARGIEIVTRSGWYRSAPVPPSSQPWYVNSVVEVKTALNPAVLLQMLQRIENEFGRIRTETNAARVLDLDILDFDGRISADPALALPHPRLHERAFVLVPLKDVAPLWRHPQTNLTAAEMLTLLAPGQVVEADLADRRE